MVDLAAHKGGEERGGEGGGGGEAMLHGDEFKQTFDLIYEISERARDRLLLPSRNASDKHVYGDPPLHNGLLVMVHTTDGLVFGFVVESTRGLNLHVSVYAEHLDDGNGG